jgi:hypothetical protein
MTVKKHMSRETEQFLVDLQPSFFTRSAHAGVESPQPAAICGKRLIAVDVQVLKVW